MRIVVTDTALIWNHNNPVLEQFKDVVLVVCLEGKKVTDKYECFISPYEQKDCLGMEQYGVESQRYYALESVADDLNRNLHYHEKVLFLTDGNPESLYPFYVIKDRNKYNSIHLCTVSPWNFEGKRRVEAHKKMLSDLSQLKSFFFIDSNEYLRKAEEGSTMRDLMEKVENDYAEYLPRIINGIQSMQNDSYFDFASKSYIPVKDGFNKIDLSRMIEDNIEIQMPLYPSFCTLGSVVPPDYPDKGKRIRDEIERPVARIDGKRICNLLHEYRIKLAESNGIEFHSEECPSIGPCAGTCAKCDQESAYLRDKLAEIPREKQKIPMYNLEEEVY